MNQISPVPVEGFAAAADAAPAGYVGKALPRVEDAALLTGRGSYADDIGVKPGTLHAAIAAFPARATPRSWRSTAAPRWRCPACARC